MQLQDGVGQGTFGAGSRLEIEDLEVVSGHAVLFISRTHLDRRMGGGEDVLYDG